MKSRKIKQLTCYKLFHQRKIFILFWLMIWVYNTVESENITIITSELQEVPICQSITGGCPTPVHFTGNTQRENELPYPLDKFPQVYITSHKGNLSRSINIYSYFQRIQIPRFCFHLVWGIVECWEVCKSTFFPLDPLLLKQTRLTAMDCYDSEYGDI